MDTTLDSSIKYDKDITVVIATIGEESLSKTIKSIMCGSVVPHKILLCIPESIEKNILHLSETYKCVEVVTTSQRGQVIQRIIGFRMSDSKFTLQLDSDVLLDKYLVENLKKSTENHSGVCVGPLIYRNSTKEHYSFLAKNCKVFRSYQKKIITRVLNGSAGYKSGIISKGGVGFGPEKRCTDNVVEWLPGCCVMHETKNLILQNFYHSQGKAYAEDLYHSYYIKKKKNGIMFDNNSKVYVNFPGVQLSGLCGLVKEQYLSFRAGIGFVRMANKSSLRFTLYSLLKIIFLVSNRVFHR